MRIKIMPSKIISVILQVLFLFFAIAPILWLFITSIKPIESIITSPVEYLPKSITFENYSNTIAGTDFLLYFRNSLFVSLVTAFFTTLLAIFSGYSLTRFKFRGKKITLLVFLVTQMIPISVIIVPLFLIFAQLKLINNLFGLIIVYSVLNIPFCTLVIKGFFQRIPIALEEAAQIDGCTRVQGIVKIILPLMQPGIVATGVFAFIGAWNELFFNSLFISSENLKTIPAAINMFVGKFNVDWGMLSAAGILALIPVCILFAIIQKYLVSGLTSGSVKD